MTNEQSFFLRALSDYYHQKKTSAPSAVLDWKKITEYAKSHSVGGIIFKQCEEFLSRDASIADIRKSLKQEQNAAYYSYIRNQSVFEELKTFFRLEQIRFVAVKGLEVAEAYPIPSLRTMGDIDLVMSRSDRDRVHDVMLKNGFILQGGGNEKHYVKAPVTIELHYALTYGGEDTNAQRMNYLNSFWDHVVSEDQGFCRLDYNFHFLFLVWHLMKHLSSGGVGFRQFMDIAVTAEKWPLDWEKIEREARKIDLWEFLQNVLLFCHRWWQVELPFQVREIDDDFFEEATESVFRNGVFGFAKEEERWAELAGKYMDFTRVPKALRPAAVAWRKVFISYDAMLTKTYCRFVKGKKYLLPFAWFYRVFYIAVHKHGRIRTWEKAIFESEDIIDRRQKMMVKWGI